MTLSSVSSWHSSPHVCHMGFDGPEGASKHHCSAVRFALVVWVYHIYPTHPSMCCREVATRALRVLRRVTEMPSHKEFLKQRFCEGLAVAAAFHARLRAAFPAHACAQSGRPVPLWAVSAVAGRRESTHRLSLIAPCSHMQSQMRVVLSPKLHSLRSCKLALRRVHQQVDERHIKIFKSCWTRSEWCVLRAVLIHLPGPRGVRLPYRRERPGRAVQRADPARAGAALRVPGGPAPLLRCRHQPERAGRGSRRHAVRPRAPSTHLLALPRTGQPGLGLRKGV